jgi:oxalate decarboxylase/phosphoglucose isomerase-like protein (cupin superfamily)
VPSKLVDPASLPTMTFEWGFAKPLVAADNTDDPAMAMLHVVLLPGKGHDRHNHPDADEILYVLAGEGDQMVDDGEPFPVRPGHTVFVPKGAFHATLNTGYEPMAILAVYAPAGAEQVLKGLPDYREVPPGRAPGLERAPHNA